MPQRLICPELNVVTLADYALPESLAPNQVLVRNTHGAEKHGTMEAFVRKHGNSRGAWDATRRMHTPGEGMVWRYPIGLGNMQVGVVEKVGSAVTRWKPGDRLVAFRPFEPWSVLGESEGWALRPDTNWKSATLLDPASFALAAIRDSATRVGDATAVFGLGAIGLMAVALARIAGCSLIIAIDPVARRRDAATRLGAHVTIDPVGTDSGARIRELTSWRGADTIIEYSGTVPALNAALRGVAFGGTIACGAFPAPFGPGLDLGGEAHINRPNIVFTRAESDPDRDHPRWDNTRNRSEVLRLILDGRLDGDAVIDPVVPFSPSLAADYERIMADKAGSVKMGVTY